MYQGCRWDFEGIVTRFFAGDCVKQGPGMHECNGMSQETAYVSVLQVGFQKLGL
jgi:hypothetical protein